MNFFPVEYEGTLAWDDHSGWWSFFGLAGSGDNEYTFNIFRPDHALETGSSEGVQDGIHLEFNSTETVDNFDDAPDSLWWKDFHHNVVDHYGLGDAANAQIAKHFCQDADLTSLDPARCNDPRHQGPFAIVIGLLGLDLPHADYHAELHPVYAMFIRQRLSATEDKWSFFVRNWGVEGYCGPANEPIQEKTIRVRLPHKTSGSAIVNPQVYTYAHDSGNKQKCSQNEWSFVQQADGVLLTFDLSDASNRCGWVGDLNIDWQTDDNSGPVQTTLARSTRPRIQVVPFVEEREDPALTARIEKLSPADRQQLLAQLRALASGAPKTTRKEPIHGPSAISAKAPKGRPNNGKGLQAVPDDQTPEQKADIAKRRQLIETFLEQHGHL